METIQKLNEKNYRLTGPLLDGKVAVVTGAATTSGIGFAIAALYALHGAKVVIVDIDGHQAIASAKQIGDQHIGIGCDVSSQTDCQETVTKALHQFGSIDILVNNAGIFSRRPFFEISREEFERTIKVNAEGSFLMAQAVLPVMEKQGKGNLVFISSTASQRGGGVFGSSHYVASKAAMTGLAQAIAREFAPKGIRSNVVAPNLVKTESVKEMTPEQRGAIEKNVPLLRSANVLDVAGAALFLASDLSAYITGATIDVNGGFHIR